MRGNGISRGMGIAVAALALAVVGAFSQSAKATWYDSATGQAVHVTPRGALGSNENNASIHDLEGHVRNLYWDNVCNTWRDSANGAEVHITPRGALGSNENNASIHDLGSRS